VPEVEEDEVMSAKVFSSIISVGVTEKLVFGFGFYGLRFIEAQNRKKKP